MPVSQPPASQAPAKSTAAAQPQRNPQVSGQSVGQAQAPPPQVAQPTSPHVQQASPPPVQQQAAGPSPEQIAKRAELMKVREALAMLSARAGSIRSTMQGVQQKQAAQGLGMRGDWVSAAGLMESFLKAADDASKASDTDAAKDFMNKAERQIEKLETAFNIR